MKNFDPQQVLTHVFLYLRRSGLDLGVGELLAALRAAEGGWGTDSPDSLRQVARLLWCNSFAEEYEFETIWAAIVPALLSSAQDHASAELPPSLPPLPESLPESLESESPPSPSTTEPVAQESRPGWGTLPVQAPFRPALLADAPELHAYWPVSRRFMVYAWRYLRRPIADGPANVLDIQATVEQAARQGFFLAPVYRRRERNHAHLVLFLDQNGSMVPFHRFTRDMVETAQDESSIEQVDAFYFHNVPAASVYQDPYLTQLLPLDRVLAPCSTDTSVLIVSDAGAARGRRRLARIQATIKFLSRIKRRTTLIAWLNPMPVDRWPGSSAQIIAHLLPMYQMDPDGLSRAIDIVRGQPLQHYG